MNNSFLAEEVGIKTGIPYDMDTVTVQPRISLAKGDRLAIVLNMGDSTAAVVNFKVNQHNAASAGTTKDLETLNPYYKKAGAATSFTKVVPTVADADYDVAADFASQEGVVVLEVLGEDCDNENGFNWVSVGALDSTATKILSVVYILNGMKFKPAYSEVL